MRHVPKVLLNLLALVGLLAAALWVLVVLTYQEGDDTALYVYVPFLLSLVVGAALVVALLISFVVSVVVDIVRWRSRS